jgi:hypothetical protein
MAELSEHLYKAFKDAALLGEGHVEYVPSEQYFLTEDMNVNSHWFSVTKLRDLSIIAACLSVALFCLVMAAATISIALDILHRGLP